METMVCSGITVGILLIWYALERTKPMTPHDIYEKWKSNMIYIAPEEIVVKLAKTQKAIRKVEEIFDQHGPNTDAGAEAVEVLQKLRKYEKELRLKA